MKHLALAYLLETSREHHTRATHDTIAAIGLAIGGAFGLAGTFVASAALRETLWAIDGAALVVATALLTMKYQRLGNDCVAPGFSPSLPARPWRRM
ncbi:hypothetical protein [Mesorhizobium sp. M0138]|uniref:hypothetical protein n=1 Tax=unclassified Mesorhizobium TaxID=325217 RepID=UPI00333629F1